MTFEVRTPEPEELEAFFSANSVAFGRHLNPERVEDGMRLAERERLLGAFEGGRCIGSAGAFRFELSVPGGSLPCAGVTWVGVLPTDRRRGVLTALMREQLRRVRAWGEPIAALWASEAPIYGRFGYGLATEHFDEVRLERVHGRLRSHPAARGKARLATRGEALAAWPAVWDAVRGQRAGLHTRSAAWWEERGVPAQEREEAGWSKDFLVSLEEDGATIGYARYRVRGEWEHGLPAGEVAVHELLGIDGGAEAALWEYVLGVDLVDRLTAHRRPMDDTLLHLLADPRRAVRRPSDALFCRVLDPAAALEGRRYAGEGRLVLEVADDFGGCAAGRFALEAGPGGARCRPTGQSADLELGAAELGSLLFGQVSALALWRAGRIAGSEAAARAADALFRWRPEPWAPEVW